MDIRTQATRCYKETKSDSKIGYMNKMKKLWDNIHPELNHLVTKISETLPVEWKKIMLSWKQNLIILLLNVIIIIMT